MNEFRAKYSCTLPEFYHESWNAEGEKKAAVYDIIPTLAARLAPRTEICPLIGFEPRLYSKALSWLAPRDIRCPAISHLFLMRSYITVLG